VVLFDGKDPARASNFGNASSASATSSRRCCSRSRQRRHVLQDGVFISAAPDLFLLVAASARFPASRPATILDGLQAAGTRGESPLALFCYISLESAWDVDKPYMTELFGAPPTGRRGAAGLILSLFGPP